MYWWYNMSSWWIVLTLFYIFLLLIVYKEDDGRWRIENKGMRDHVHAGPLSLSSISLVFVSCVPFSLPFFLLSQTRHAPSLCCSRRRRASSIDRLSSFNIPRLYTLLLLLSILVAFSALSLLLLLHWEKHEIPSQLNYTSVESPIFCCRQFFSLDVESPSNWTTKSDDRDDI